MVWRVVLGVALVIVVTLAAVVIATMSAGGPGDAQRVQAALRLSANCAPAFRRPSHASIMRKWAGSTVQTADVVCAAPGLRVAYARFPDARSLSLAVALNQPPGRYCVFGASIMLDALAGVDTTLFTDMCRSLGGTPVSAGP